MAKEGSRSSWRRLIAVAVSSLAALAALIALRGPDAIAPTISETTGAWLLSGPALWQPLALFGAPSQLLLVLGGPRGWQNAHIVVAWFSILCWFRGLPPGSWRGLGPLIPALLAVVLSNIESGWSGLGLSVLVFSLWYTATRHSPPRTIAATMPVAAWLAVWLSPGGLWLAAAALLDAWPRLPRKLALFAALATVVATQITPRGFGVWSEARVFTFWSPQAPLDAPGLIALLLVLVLLALAAGAVWRSRSDGSVIAPALLLLGAMAGQTALLWPAALWLIPSWSVAVGQWRHMGFNFRWWMQAAAIVVSAGLVAWQSATAMPRWYALAMTDAVVRPTLTRSALPADAKVYVNPRGRAIARLAGQLPRGADAVSDPRLAREPSLWRAQDRKERFTAVWLLGDKSDYAPLARHLGESPDWRLEAVDATGVLFARAPRANQFATEPAQQRAREMWGGANRSAFLAGSALACLAANALPEAGELSTAAVRNSDLSAPAAAARGRVQVSLGDVRGALDQSERAIRLDPTLPFSWEVRSEAMLHAGLNDNAYAAALKAAELAPGDAGALWLAARAANAARAFQTEAELLERLAALTEARGGDAAFYRLYLGQAYAKQGLARPALRELGSASAAPGLTDAQRRELDEEIARIKSSPDAR